MKTKNNARILAWLVSICMIVALIPAMPAEYAQAADGDLVLEFDGLNSQGSPLYHPYASVDKTEFLKTLTYSTTTSTSPYPWEFVTCSAGSSNLSLLGATANVLYLQAAANESSSFSIKFKVDDTGYYNISSNYRLQLANSSTATGLFEIYDISNPNENLMSLSIPGDTGGFINSDIGGAYLESDTEYVFRATESSTYKNTNYLYVTSLTLSPAKVTADGISTAMAMNSTASATLAVSAGSTSLDFVVKTVDSSDKSVVTASFSDKALTVNSLASGYAEITVVLDVDGTELTETYPIVVRPASPTDGSLVYYFSGMINESVKLYTETSAKSPDATNLAIVANAVNYTTTAAKLSSPWKVHTAYRSSAAAGKNVTVNPNNITIENAGGSGTVAYISITNTPGWYTVKTDADINASGGTNKLTVYNVVNNALATENLLYVQTEVDGAYTIDKPIYLSGTESCFLFELAGKTGSVVLNSLTLVPVTDEKDIALEASSEVPETMTVGDEATVVSFKVGVMTPAELSVAVEGAAVTAVKDASAGTVTFTAAKVGTATVTVTATYGDKEVSAEYPITVKPEISTHEIFGSKYAYVKKNADSTYNVSFIGGLHSIVGFEAAGFEVWKDGTQVAEAKTNLAYKQITYTLNSQTVTKTPSDYGVADATGYIFLEAANAVNGDTAYAFTAGTYTIKPYVIEGGEKKYHEIDLSLVIG